MWHFDSNDTGVKWIKWVSGMQRVRGDGKQTTLLVGGSDIFINHILWLRPKRGLGCPRNSHLAAQNFETLFNAQYKGLKNHIIYDDYTLCICSRKEDTLTTIALQLSTTYNVFVLMSVFLCVCVF